MCGLVAEDVDDGVGDEKENVSKDNASEQWKMLTINERNDTRPRDAGIIVNILRVDHLPVLEMP